MLSTRARSAAPPILSSVSWLPLRTISAERCHERGTVTDITFRLPLSTTQEKTPSRGKWLEGLAPSAV